MSDFTPIWDYYRCDTCLGYFVTVQIEPGIIRDSLGCMATKDCTGRMNAQAFKLRPAQWPRIVPKIANGEWIRPVLNPRTRKKYPAIARWVEKENGLVMRAPSDSTPAFPQEEPETKK